MKTRLFSCCHLALTATWTLAAGTALLLYFAVRRRLNGGAAIRMPYARESDEQAS